MDNPELPSAEKQNSALTLELKNGLNNYLLGESKELPKEYAEKWQPLAMDLGLSKNEVPKDEVGMVKIKRFKKGLGLKVTSGANEEFLVLCSSDEEGKHFKGVQGKVYKFEEGSERAIKLPVKAANVVLSKTVKFFSSDSETETAKVEVSPAEEVRLLKQEVAESIVPIVYPKGKRINFEKKRKLVGRRGKGEIEGSLKSINIEVGRELSWGEKKIQEVMVAGKTPGGDYRMKIVMEPENKKVFRVGRVQKYSSSEKAYLPAKIFEAKQWLGSLAERPEDRFRRKLNLIQREKAKKAASGSAGTRIRT